MDGFNHLSESGEARMVDVGSKDVTARTAVAEATLRMSGDVRSRLFDGDLPKGDALAAARIAAVMAAKRTSELIPLCHPIGLDAVEVTIEETADGARLVVTASVTAKTGVEMEAMTGASVGAVALYDMIKGLDRGASIEHVQLLSKTGGKSGDWHR